MKQAKSIKEQIESLIGLQAVDMEIYAFNREKAEKPDEIKEIEGNLESKKTAIKKAEEELKGFQLKLKDREVTLQQKEEQIKKLQTQLYQLKSNKDYSTMLTEIEGIKADNSLIEEEMIKLMDQIESAKNKLTQEKEVFKNEEVNAKKEKDVINARIAEIDAKLSGLKIKRDVIAPDVEKYVLMKYERVLENRDGLAMVKIEDGSCGGCHMNLPPQVISEVKIREDIIICGNCSRILYIDGDIEF